MPSFHRMLVVADPPEASESLLAQAAGLAQVLVPEQLDVLYPLGGPGRTADEEEAMRTALERRMALLSGRDGHIPTTLSVTRDDVLESVLSRVVAARVDLVVIGTAPQGLGRRALARRLAMQAPCSVWMAPAGSTLDFTRMLIAVDLSPRAAEVLGVGTALAAAAGAERCHALYVRFDNRVARSEGFEDEMLARERDAFTIFAARVDFHGIDVEPLFEEGPDVARTVLRVADDTAAGLVVMGTRGRTRAAALLLGSETEHVLLHSSRPVLAIKHFGARLRFVEALLDPRFRARSGPGFG